MMRTTASFTALALAAVAIGFPSVAAQSVPPKTASTAAPIETLTVASAEKLLLELETPLHTRSTRAGDRASFRTADEVLVGNRVAIPRGSFVRATVTKVQRPGRLKGRAELRLHFEEVRLADGTILPLSASVLRAGFNPVSHTKEGEPRLKGEAGSGGNVTVVAQGGLQGAILGAAVGGRRGAAYGSVVGAGVGLAGVLLRRGPDLDLPRNTMFEVKVDHPLEIPVLLAERAAAMGRNNPPPFVSGPGVLSRPDDKLPADADAERVPEFSRDEGRPVETGTVNPSAESPPARAIPKPTDPVSDDPAGFKISVDVQLVLVDAVIRDRIGRPLDDLRREDFQLFEDNVEQTIRSFSRDELPLALALVIDRSGSVAPYMNELRRAAYRALLQLKRGDQVALFAFAGEVDRLEDLTTDRQRIADRIAGIRAGGGTNIVDAVFDAVYYLAMVAPQRRRAVILISDNHATTRPRASESQTIRMAMESETVVYSVKTQGMPTPLTMRIPTWLGGTGSVGKITEETGGEIIDVMSVGSLDAALAAVVSRLRLRYSLGYYPARPFQDTAFRKIDVRLADRFGHPGRDYSVHARRGYYPPSPSLTASSKP